MVSTGMGDREDLSIKAFAFIRCMVTRKLAFGHCEVKEWRERKGRRVHKQNESPKNL
jgi:hypothetical protein